MTWQLVETDELLHEVIAAAVEYPAVAIDTEFMRRNTFYPQVALLQLCFADKAWLIDPLAISDLGPLIDLMENPAVVKILHSASEDLEVFQQWLGVLPRPLFDTQRAAAFVDRGFGLGYRALVLDICDIDLDKGDQRSDWLQRPLTESQCDYAAQDVIHLLTVWRDLDAQCEEQGKREWVFSDSDVAGESLATASGQYFKRIKTAWKLPPRQQHVLVAICDWREQTARQKDKPRSWIIDDKACLQLAEQDPANWAELKAVTELPPPVLRRYGDDLLAVLAAHREGPDSHEPLLSQPLNGQQRQQLKQLKQAAKKIAGTLAMAPEALLQSKDYETLVREACGESISEPNQWAGWRSELVLSPLRAYLAESQS